jgi:hypothetical protein
LLSASAHAQPELEDEGTTPTPAPSAYPPPSARWAVTLGGLGAAVAFYGGAVGASYAFPDVPGAKDLRIPLVGPWQAIAHNGCAPNETDCSDAWVAFRTIITALDGVAQAGSLVIAIEGLFLPTQEVSPAAPAAPSRDKAPTPAPRPSPKPTEQPTPEPSKNLFWLPTPMVVGERGVGIGVVGRF